MDELIGNAKMPRLDVGMRSIHGKLFAVGGDDNTMSFSISRFSRHSKKWTVVQTIPEKRNYTASAAVNNEIIITGGFDGTKGLDSVHFLDKM